MYLLISICSFLSDSLVNVAALKCEWVILQISIYWVPLKRVLVNIGRGNYMLRDEWFDGLLCYLYVDVRN